MSEAKTEGLNWLVQEVRELSVHLNFKTNPDGIIVDINKDHYAEVMDEGLDVLGCIVKFKLTIQDILAHVEAHVPEDDHPMVTCVLYYVIVQGVGGRTILNEGAYKVWTEKQSKRGREIVPFGAFKRATGLMWKSVPHLAKIATSSGT